MIRLSIQTRQGVSRLILPLLVALSCGLLVVSQVDRPLAASLRGALADRLVPVYLLLHRPVEAWRKLSAEAASLVRLEAENRRLRAENDELHSWYRAALALADVNGEIDDIRARHHLREFERFDKFLIGQPVALDAGAPNLRLLTPAERRQRDGREHAEDLE